MKILHLCVVTVAGLMLVGCNDENPWLSGNGTGGIIPKIVPDVRVTEAKPILRSEETLTAPLPQDFALKISKTDGSFSKEWERFSSFDENTAFPVGAYTMEASYGSPDEEGFDSPYFYGATQLSVKEDETTEVSVTASLANAMVSIDYTDDFKHFFPQYSTQLHSDGGAYLDFAADETRPAFVKPGNVAITMSLTKQNGISATFQPADFAVEAKHHYHLTFDANNGNTGDVQLSIIFDESVEQEDIVIDLTDELMLSPAPVVNTVGFTSGQTINMLQGSDAMPLKTVIMAQGGIKDVMLSTNCPALTSSLGSEINLMTLSQIDREKLQNSGLDVTGLWKGDASQAKMASIDFTNLVASLSGSATYTFGIVVKDKLTKVNEPVILSVTTVPIEINFVAIDKSIIGTDKATARIRYNGTDFARNVTVEAKNEYGVWDACNVKVLKNEGDIYNVEITVPQITSDIPVRLKFRDEVKAESQIERIVPEYDIEVDAFARHAVVKINSDDDVKAGVTNSLRIFTNATGTTLSRDPEHGLITVSGLNPSTTYTVRSCIKDGEYTPEQTIMTEAATQIANGDFADTRQTINITNINAGGQFGTTSLRKNINKSSIVVSEPTGWASVNENTCYIGSNPQNTWFMVPSTLMDGGEVVVRSVAYDHNGTMPAFSAAAATGYSKNAPTSFAGYASGELFLGSYSYDGSAHRTDGISFGSRPSSLTFKYSYTPYSGEQGEAYIMVLDASGNVIAQASKLLDAQSSMQTATVNLPTYTFGSKAASIRICFRSTRRGITPATYTPTGTGLNDNNSIVITGTTLAANSYKSLSVGSVLRVDDVVLTY